jgi:hypothetical protein
MAAEIDTAVLPLAELEAQLEINGVENKALAFLELILALCIWAGSA